MLNPSMINIVSFFYPIGNTPAVCLTQDLSPEKSADILLLGCGDVRNLLFTTYYDAPPSPRQLDFTCCDIESAIIARNIVILSLLIDDTHGQQHSIIWQIYYHLYIDAQSIKVLQAQASKLLSLADSLQSWQDGKYGKILKFCDQETLDMVKKLWKAYSVSDRTKEQQSRYDVRFKNGIQEAVDKKKAVLGSGMIMTGLRSAAPTSLQAIQDSPKVHDHFWKHGTTDRNPSNLTKDRNSNPTFFPEDQDNFTLHYGTDPQLGFPLATAYVPLTKESPLAPGPGARADIHKVIDAARISFQAWSNSFRKHANTDKLTIRFFAGDAIAFCHTLQYIEDTGDTQSHWFRRNYSFQSLELDATHYGSYGSAPTVFNVVDTSNLIDNLGPINVLVAASPLLKRQASSTLYSESLVAREKDRKDLMDKILCGSFSTMSLLLGIIPIEYWTNTTVISSVDEETSDASPRLSSASQNSDNGNGIGQMRCRMAWKISFPISEEAVDRKLSFDPLDLACLIHRIYQGMFEHEDMMKRMTSFSLRKMHHDSYPSYHRGSFAAMLKFFQSRVDTNWDKMMDLLLSQIENDNFSIVGRNYLQQLYLQLHLLGIRTFEPFKPSFKYAKPEKFKNGLGSWKEIPPVVCITLEVPRAKLEVFTTLPRNQLGTPLVHAIVQSVNPFAANAWQNIFADVHLSFGKVCTVGGRDKDNFRVLVEEDELGWKGQASLILSFNVPAWVVLHDPLNTVITFGVQSTPHSIKAFLGRLGLGMNVFVANILDEKYVKISKFHPHQSGHPAIGRLVQYCHEDPVNIAVTTSIIANIDQSIAQISGFTGRLDFLFKEAKSLLKSGATVKLTQVSPCVVSVCIGGNGTSYNINFPLPVLEKQSKTRIARTSSFIEVIVPIADHVTGHGFPHFMYPVGLRDGIPTLTNIPYLNLQRLPVINVSKSKELGWLHLHTALQLSARERALRDKSTVPGSSGNTDVRTDFKLSLFSMFMRFSGVQGEKAHVFALNNPTGGGVHIMIFVSCLLLDLANHTAVLDAAVLPLTNNLVIGLAQFLGPLRNICQITVNDEELKLWRQVLPALVERCRDWKHRSTCEYIAASKIPLSTDEKGAPVICSCGNGILPDKFIAGLPNWENAKKHMTRAAISPSFSVPYVEPTLEIKDVRASTDGQKVCRNCNKKKGTNGANLLRCSKCLVVWYCSRECQVSN